MAIEPLFENLSFILPKTKQDTYIDVQAKTNVQEDQLEKVLHLSAFPSVSDGAESDAKIEFTGKVVFYLSYSTTDGEVHKCECTAEYLGAIDKGEINYVKNGITLTASPEKCEYVLEGGELIVKAKIKVSSRLFGEEKIKLLSGGEGLITQTAETSIVKSLGIKKTLYPIEEEFELSYQVKDVVSQTVSTNVTAVQCGVGCIIVDGEIFLSLMLLQNIEKSDIIRENKTIPFRVEIDYEDAMPALSASVTVSERAIKTDVEVDGESGKSLVKSKISLCFYGEAFSEESVILIKDAFNKEQDLQADFCECNFATDKQSRNFQTEVTVRAETEDLPAGIRLTAVGGESVEIVSTMIKEGGLEISGVLSATVFLKDSEGKNDARKLNAPFTVLTDFSFESGIDIQTHAVCKSAKAKIISLSSIELSASVIFKTESYKNKSFKYLTGVSVCGEKAVNDCAISVFIAQENEELWSLAKRLNVCPEELLETNKELQFPLTGNERIVIYRPKIK